MDDPLFQNLNLNSRKAYFLYIGEIKAFGLNHFLCRSLERHYGKPVDFISIVPDVLAEYPHDNIMVVNDRAFEAYRDTGIQHNIRLQVGEFAREVSNNRDVMNLVDRLVHDQGDVFINVFESRPELTFVNGDRVRLIGPDPELARSFNNKLVQYDMACRLGIPVPSGECCPSLQDAATCAQEMIVRGYSVFLSQEYSSAGSNSMIAATLQEIETRFTEPDCGYLVTTYLEHDHDPTVLGIVAGEHDVYIASVADQTIEGTRFRGSTFPTVLPEKTVEDLKEMTRIIGRDLGSKGYRGAFGCDYIVDLEGEVYFIEVNARKQGTTMETALTMDHRLPGHPTFPELEFEAVERGRFPQPLEEMDSTESGICWGTYNYKVDRDILVTSALPPMADERDLFQRVAEGDGDAGYTILDHVGKSVRQTPGGFLGRVIAVAADISVVQSLLEEGKSILRSTVEEYNQ